MATTTREGQGDRFVHVRLGEVQRQYGQDDEGPREPPVPAGLVAQEDQEEVGERHPHAGGQRVRHTRDRVVLVLAEREGVQLGRP